MFNDILRNGGAQEGLFFLAHLVYFLLFHDMNGEKEQGPYHFTSPFI